MRKGVSPEIASSAAEILSGYDPCRRVFEQCAGCFNMTSLATQRQAADHEISKLLFEFEVLTRQIEILEPARIAAGEMVHAARPFPVAGESPADVEALFEEFGVTALEAKADQLGRQARQVLDRIASTPARSLTGLSLKARAIARLHGGDVIDFGGERSDLDLARSIVTDLLAMNRAAA